jgi:hypothetical protein
LIRQRIITDQNPYTDVDMSGAAADIEDLYQTSNLPGSQDESGATLRNFNGAHLRVSGSGSLNMVVAGLDGNISIVPAASPIALTPKEGQELLVKYFLRSEQQTLSFSSTAGVDQYFILALVRAYYNDAMPQR